MSEQQPVPPPPEDLPALRARIDEIDAQLLALMSERGRLAQVVGRRKARDGTPIYAPDREAAILERLCRENPGPLSNETLLAVYREIMSGSFALERPLRIAFLGPRGTFSHLAASGKFGASVEYQPVGSIADAFHEVERRHADYGVVPIENSLGGSIRETLDAFLDTTAQICAEISCRIHHHLLARRPLAEIARVYSKPEIFTQCRRWLHETGLVAKTVPVASSSRAAELAAQEADAAAIGSALAAELHQLPIQVEHIEDDRRNVTRFAVLGRTSPGPTGNDKTSVLFAVAHQAGALMDVLSAFRAAEVNLTMLTSLPNQQNAWQYYFFVDAEGHQSDPPLRDALAAAQPHCVRLAVLGSYPRAELVL
jgi:chorismate mutase/prephenate dehydratase